MSAETPVISCQQLKKTYTQGTEIVEVLRDISMEITSGDQVAIVGSSGSGKTTLLNLLGGLDLPTEGTVYMAGKNIALVNDAERGHLRNKYLGFVYQFHHLLGEFTALENVCMPLLIAGVGLKTAKERATNMLLRVSLGDRMPHKPTELSGGERQRVARARALVGNPRCVLLDEPTGNLDRHSAMEIQELITELNRTLGIGFVVVTHNEQLADSMNRSLLLKDGSLNEG